MQVAMAGSGFGSQTPVNPLCHREGLSSVEDTELEPLKVKSTEVVRHTAVAAASDIVVQLFAMIAKSVTAVKLPHTHTPSTQQCDSDNQAFA
jgi:hypothetical protein